MPDETIVQNWTCQTLPNLESGSGPSSLTGGSAGLQGVSFHTFDPLYGGAGAVFPSAASVIGTLFTASDPFTSKGLQVDITGAGTAVTLLCALLVNASNGDLAAVTVDYSASIATGMFPMYWTGDTDSNAVGLKFSSGSYYMAVGAVATTTLPSLLALTATAANVGLLQPKLRNAVLATGLTAGTPPSAALTMSGMTSSSYVPYIQVI
jgi:hypothetical protein